MPDFDLYSIEESEITISNGAVLSGFTQGTGEHLLGETITLNSNNFQLVTITDNDNFFADNDGNQTLTNAVVYDGVSYAAGTRVEAEYTLTLQAPDGTTFTMMGFNIREPGGNPAYGTVEGLAFLGTFPPVGVTLTVIGTSEGPRQNETLYTDYYAPPCFTEGTRIETPDGQVPVETLGVGDLVHTLDNGPQPVRWIGKASFSRQQLIADARLRPIRLQIGEKLLTVSPQHRVLVSGWAAELACGEDVLVAAKHLAEAGRARALRPEQLPPDGVGYWHIMFDRHEIVFSNGIASESFLPGPEAMRALPDVHAEFERFFPQFQKTRVTFVPARRCATRHEGRIVAQGL